MERLDHLEEEAIYLVREAYFTLGRIAALWSMGKDSTTLLWICRKAFLGEIPFPVIHIDTGLKIPSMYGFRDRLAREWSLDLHVVRNETAITRGTSPSSSDRIACCTALKTGALKGAVRELGLRGLLLAIRRDEHGVRAKERYFSPRTEAFSWEYLNQPMEAWGPYQASSAVEGSHHTRVHAMLNWTELDIWRYIRREGIPVSDLYFARNGKRYRSLGCYPCCEPVPSGAATVDEIIREVRTCLVSERSGRAQDKERIDAMQRLRALGYM